MRELASEWRGVEYNLFRKNCCTFVREACLRLGVEEVELPRWLTNLTEGFIRTGEFFTLPLVPFKFLSEKVKNMNMAEFTAEGFEIAAAYEQIASSKVVIMDVVEAEKRFLSLPGPVAPIEVRIVHEHIVCVPTSPEMSKSPDSSELPKNPKVLESRDDIDVSKNKFKTEIVTVPGAVYLDSYDFDPLSLDTIFTFSWPS
uniref:PPPDE domain-containing protein n=1 Tax=Corethron hystrix TaxID=216773 RepID=A0A7S1B7V7_9STRA|mmetsp:Transcript_16218/g.36481  ORF Transcript_16218/g.36481 Transcript_16218/m.36481 type:complete len:200 (+) Transcript_16218:790-1389(+)